MESLDTLGVARVGGNGTTPRATQRQARQVLRCGWHDTPQRCSDGRSESLGQSYLNAVRTLAHQIDIVLSDHDARRQRGEIEHIPELGALGDKPPWQVLRLWDDEDAIRGAVDRQGGDTLTGTSYYYPQATRSIYATLEVRF